MPVTEISRGILDQKPPAEPFLGLLDVTAKDVEALLRIGERQQIVEIGSTDGAPREVLGDQHRLDQVDQLLEAREMTMVEFLVASQGHGDAVKAHRIAASQLEEPVQSLCLGHIVLGMHLEEAYIGPGGRDLRHMRQAQADPHAAASGRSMLDHDRGLVPVASVRCS
jgi:hypothetical protein